MAANAPKGSSCCTAPMMRHFCAQYHVVGLQCCSGSVGEAFVTHIRSYYGVLERCGVREDSRGDKRLA